MKTDTKAFDEAEKGVKEKIAKLLAINGKQSVDDIHKKLGHIMWENVGMARTKESLEKAITEIQALRKEFWKDVKVVGKENDLSLIHILHPRSRRPAVEADADVRVAA